MRDAGGLRAEGDGFELHAGWANAEAMRYAGDDRQLAMQPSKLTEFIMLVSIFTITFMTFGIAGLAVGFGTMYPRFETENAAQIPTSFGGLLFMMASIVMIGTVISLEARPVFSYLASRAFGAPPDPAEMIIGFGLAGIVCIVATLIPIRIALRRLDALEV